MKIRFVTAKASGWQARGPSWGWWGNIQPSSRSSDNVKPTTSHRAACAAYCYPQSCIMYEEILSHDPLIYIYTRACTWHFTRQPLLIVLPQRPVFFLPWIIITHERARRDTKLGLLIYRISYYFKLSFKVQNPFELWEKVPNCKSDIKILPLSIERLHLK